MLRQPVVADRFYPGNPSELKRVLDNFIPSSPTSSLKKAVAVVSPHAGYIYSGEVAALTFARVNIPETVIILGPNHHGHGKDLAVGTEDWSMPFGPVPINRTLASLILEGSDQLVADNTAHLYEHSLEVQVPFLQYFQNNLSIVPIVVSHLRYDRCQAAAKDIARALSEYEGNVLMVASTDMTHYESRSSATKKDRLALDRIENLDPSGLYETVVGNRISMCGIMPTTIALLAADELGATNVELVRYTDSGAVSGDTDQVVGYAGLIIS